MKYFKPSLVQCNKVIDVCSALIIGGVIARLFTPPTIQHTNLNITKTSPGDDNLNICIQQKPGLIGNKKTFNITITKDENTTIGQQNVPKEKHDVTVCASNGNGYSQCLSSELNDSNDTISLTAQITGDSNLDINIF